MKPFPGDACPRANCDGHLVVRTNTITYEKFLGCSNWPKCDHAEPIERGEE